MNAARQFSNPFPGLRPFSMEEKYLFFGREEQTMELLSRLRRNRFLAVVGTSGSGKSSLVKAGLLPELYGGTMTSAGSNWEVVLMRPGGNPVSRLATALCGSGLLCGPEPSSEQEDLLPHVRATLNRSALGLVEAIRKSNLSALTNVLLVVDQFEEIFRFSQSKGGVAEDAFAFVKLLLEASAQSKQRIYVLLTMRSDFLGGLRTIPRFAGSHQSRRVSHPPDDPRAVAFGHRRTGPRGRRCDRIQAGAAPAQARRG